MMTTTKDKLIEIGKHALSALSSAELLLIKHCPDHNWLHGFRKEKEIVRENLEYIQSSEAQPVFSWITEQHIADLARFDETTQDDQSYDISKEGMVKLAEAGLVRHLSAGRYETTDFGIYILTDKYRLHVATEQEPVSELAKALDKLDGYDYKIEVRDGVNELFVTVNGNKIFKDYYGSFNGISFKEGMTHKQARDAALILAIDLALIEPVAGEKS